jgi:hypothetical protein
MKWIIVAIAVLGVAGVAAADPPEKKAEPEKAAKKPPAKRAAKKAPAKKAPAEKAPAKAEDASAAPKVAGPPAPTDLRVKDAAVAPINLFPEKVMRNRATTATERQQRMTLGDDGNWKVQAAQVGAMVGIFGALVGLCGGGKCLVPKQVTDVLPDWMQAEQPVYSNPRAEQPLRKAR